MVGPDISYDYDLGGNRIDVNGVASTPGPANRLASDGRYFYDYDYEGNLTSRYDSTSGQLLEFGWDHRNRLVEIIEHSAGSEFSLAYEYDAFNRRVSRTQSVDGGEGSASTTAEKYVYDGGDVVFDFTSIDGADFELARRYLHGPASCESIRRRAGIAINRRSWCRAGRMTEPVNST